jgi:outer membrane protein assembly factor BamB
LLSRKQPELRRLKIIISLLAGGGMIAAAHSVAAQSSEHSFTRLDGFDIFRSVTADGAGGLVAVGSLDGADAGRSIGVIRREDAEGQILINARIGDDPSFAATVLADIMRLRDGDYIAAGWQRMRDAKHDDCLVMRFRPDGQIVWNQRLGSADHERCYFVVGQLASDLIVGGRHEKPDEPKPPAWGIVWRMDPKTGAARPGSRRAFAAAAGAGTAARSAFQSATLLKDGSLVLGGWATDDARRGDDGWLMELKPDGTKKWETRLGQTGDNLIEGLAPSGSGGVVAFGSGTPVGTTIRRGLIAAVNADGRTEWLHYVDGGAQGPDTFHHGIQMADGRLIAVGAAKPPNTASLLGWLVELDRQGALLHGSTAGRSQAPAATFT